MVLTSNVLLLCLCIDALFEHYLNICRILSENKLSNMPVIMWHCTAMDGLCSNTSGMKNRALSEWGRLKTIRSGARPFWSYYIIRVPVNEMHKVDSAHVW